MNQDVKESIRIRNLGPLKNIEIPDIRPFTILIGESSSGKSLLMKTLVLFRYIYKMLNIRWYLKNAHVNRSRFKLKMDSLLSPELKTYFKNRELEVEYAVEINGRIHKVAYRNEKIERNSTDSVIPNDDLIFLKEAWISEMRNIIPEWAAYGYAPKNRNLDFYFQETYSDFQDATDIIGSVDLDYVGVRLEVERKVKQKKYVITPADGSYRPLELRFASSGIQTSSSLMTLLQYFSDSFSFKDAIQRSIINYLYESNALTLFKPGLEPAEMRRMIHLHVEEPEQNLYPDAQCRLMDKMAEIIFKPKLDSRNLRLFMATHSPYMVNYLNVLVNRKESATRIKPGNLAAYRIYDGNLINLVGSDSNGNPVVDTMDLTEQMSAIMEEYSTLVQ